MMIELNAIEVRVLGVLVEKYFTTPEYYPLTLHALVTACNQKSNRDPVVEYDAKTVNDAIESMKPKGLVRTMIGGDSRVPKYKHYFAESFNLTTAEEALLTILMLRGPQTVGELRSRTERMYNFSDISDVELVLEALIQRSDGPLISRLPRQTGQKESRVAHLLAGEPVIAVETTTLPSPEQLSKRDRLQQLEDEVMVMKEELRLLHQDFDSFKQQFD